MKRLFIASTLLFFSHFSQAYPIDGYPYTGIKRLDYYNLAQQGIVEGMQLPAGAKYPMERILPRLEAFQDLSTGETDTEYNQQIVSFLGEQTELYGVALLDISDPDKPIYSEHNANYKSNVGSVGKIVVATALFKSLAELYPDDIAARENTLRNTRVIADRFIERDGHRVPVWNIESRELNKRALIIGDEASLWEYLDWTLSASSNAAASVVMREVMLLQHFGRDYPVSVERAQDFLTTTSSSELRELMLSSLNGALESSGIDTESYRQGSFFTAYPNNRIGGMLSYGTPRELIKVLLMLEKGQLVDEFSSREIKRLLYMTERRIRYVSHPALNDSAVFFKSGSLYSCEPEEGFRCGKYQGNKRNTLASVAIIETEKEGRDLHYLVVVISNVLRVNSAIAHQTLGLRIHRMIEARQAAPVGKDSL